MKKTQYLEKLIRPCEKKPTFLPKLGPLIRKNRTKPEQLNNYMTKMKENAMISFLKMFDPPFCDPL